MDKFTKMFLILGGYVLWTYSVMPDIQTSLVAIQTGVNKDEIIKLWALGLSGTAVFFYALYRVGQLPS